MLTYIQTPDGISVILGGKLRTVSSKEPHYEEFIAAVKNGGPEAACLEILQKELRRVEAAVAALTEREVTADVKISGGQVLFRGEAIHNSLTERMLKQLDEGFDLVPMAHFLANLVENPSRRAVMDLYSFLEYGKMPITPDGCFLAYKAVRKDFKDIHSGTFDNSVGESPSMLRFKVDEDPNVTCSRGLHVCSFDYLPHFSHADGHVMVCKVNPRDVVAIPTDYHNTKMRVTRYEVISEYEGYYQEHPECKLSQTTVAVEGKPFTVTVRGTAPNSVAYELLSEASTAAEAALKLDSTDEVTITNTETDTVVFDKSNYSFEGYGDDEDENDDEFNDDENDDEADDEDSERETTFEVITFETEMDFDNGSFEVTQSGIETFAEAKRVAFNIVSVDYDPRRFHTVQVRRELGTDKGEVLLTVS